MTGQLALFATAMFVAAAAAPALSAEHISAAANSDYVLYWLPYGVKGTGPEGTHAFNIQTPNFAAAFDVNRMTLTHFRGLPGIGRSDAPERTSDALFEQAFPASMQMLVRTDDGDYRLSGWDNQRARLKMYDGGKFCYHIRVENAGLRRDDGQTLPGTAALEIFAWADKLFVTIEFTPESDVAVSSAELELSFTGPFDRCLSVTGTEKRLSGLAQGGRTADGGGDLTCVYQQGKEGVAICWPVPEDFTGHSVSQAGSAVKVSSGIRTDPGAWKARETRRVSFQLLGTHGDSEKQALADLENERSLVGFEVLKTSSGGTDVFQGYQPRRGYYWIDHPATPTEKSLHREDVNFTERVSFRTANRARIPRRVRLMASQGIAKGIEGPYSVLTDGEGWPTGLDVQVSKNWHGQVWYHSYTVLTLAPGQVQDQTLLVGFQNWGDKPSVCHGQLSLVGYDDNSPNDWQNAAVNCQAWYEMSQGLTESICYDPTSFHCDNVICDVRPMFFREKTGSWWATNVGGGDFLAYVTPDGRKQTITQPKVFHDMQCPCLTDIRHEFVTPDGKVRQSVRARSFANTDMLRAIYSIRVDVLEDIEFRSFSIFTLGAPNYNACKPRRFAYGSAEGLEKIVEIDYSQTGYQKPGVVARGNATWVALYDDEHPAGGPEIDGGANRGLIVRSCRARINGKPSGSISLDVNRITGNNRPPTQMILEANPAGADGYLKAGDFIEAELEMVIYHKAASAYIGPDRVMRRLLETHADSYEPVLMDARHNDIRVSTQKGRGRGRYPVVVRLEDGESEFEITGGMGYVPVEIRGFRDYRDIALQQYRNGQWTDIDQSVNGMDFWQAQYDPQARSYTGVFNIPIEPLGRERAKTRLRVVRRTP